MLLATLPSAEQWQTTNKNSESFITQGLSQVYEANNSSQRLNALIRLGAKLSLISDLSGDNPEAKLKSLIDVFIRAMLNIHFDDDDKNTFAQTQAIQKRNQIIRFAPEYISETPAYSPVAKAIKKTLKLVTENKEVNPRKTFLKWSLMYRTQALVKRELLAVKESDQLLDYRNNVKRFNTQQQDAARVYPNTQYNGFVRIINNGTNLVLARVDTENNSAHGIKGCALIVMGAYGDIYLGDTIEDDENNLQAHASLIGGSHVLFGGRITIQPNSPISILSDYTGHYNSELLNLYNILRHFHHLSILPDNIIAQHLCRDKHAAKYIFDNIIKTDPVYIDTVKQVLCQLDYRKKLILHAQHDVIYIPEMVNNKGEVFTAKEPIENLAEGFILSHGYADQQFSIGLPERLNSLSKAKYAAYQALIAWRALEITRRNHVKGSLYGIEACMRTGFFEPRQHVQYDQLNKDIIGEDMFELLCYLDELINEVREQYKLKKLTYNESYPAYHYAIILSLNALLKTQLQLQKKIYFKHLKVNKKTDDATIEKLRTNFLSNIQFELKTVQDLLNFHGKKSPLKEYKKLLVKYIEDIPWANYQVCFNSNNCKMM